MLNIHNLSVSFGGSYLFEEVTFRLGAGDRVGLVGKNGAGKSTMLKILARDFAPDSGSIAQEKEIKMGFLRQDIDFEQGRTVWKRLMKRLLKLKLSKKSWKKSITNWLQEPTMKVKNIPKLLMIYPITPTDLNY
jgi:ATP-binding cassette subfamily F protein 3